MSQITTVTSFKFKTIGTKIWGLSMMQLAHQSLKKINGQSFYKLMGSGRGLGFSALPDWSTYVLLQVWESEEAAQVFFDTAEILQRYKMRVTEIWTVYLKSISAHGQWDGCNPFHTEESLPGSEIILVLTRATIKWHKLIPFWSYVPTSHKSLNENPGLIYTKGVGELPVIQMATLSIWRDKESLNNFAYISKEHREAIHMTRQLKWYKEELFARFRPYKSVGTWEGENPIAKYL